MTYTSGEASAFGTDYPDWVSSDPVTGADGTTTYSSNSGTLTYTLSSSTAGADFTFAVQVNPLFVPVGTESITSVLGNIKVTVGAGVDDAVSAAVPVTVVSQAAELTFDYFTIDEDLTASLSSNNISMSGSSAVSNVQLSADGAYAVDLSARIMMNRSFADASYTVTSSSAGITLSIPEKATYTSNYTDIYEATDLTEKLGDGVKLELENNYYDTTTPYTGAEKGYIDIQRTVIKDVTLSSYTSNGVSVLADNSGDFATVDFSAYKDDWESADLQSADLQYDITAKHIFIVVETYDITNNKFVYTTIKSVNAAQTDTAYVVESTDQDLYTASYSTNSDRQTYNLYDGTIQTLFSARRTTSPANTSISQETDYPIVIEYKAIPNEDDGYLDDVTQVQMTIPFLGSGAYPRYMSSITSLTVWYESDDEDKNGITTETGREIDIATFATSLAKGDFDGSSSKNQVIIAATDTTPAVTYYFTTSYPPTLYFDSPEGDSIVKIQAEFSSDNGTYMANASTELSKVLGTPKSDYATDDYSDYQFTLYLQDDEGTALTSATKETYSIQAQSSIKGFRWTEAEPFELVTSNSTPSSTVYQYNIAKYNTQINDDNSTYIVDGYQNFGSVQLSNGSTTAMGDGYSIVVDYDINDSSNDVVKELYFPYDPSNGVSSISTLEYTLSNGASYKYDNIADVNYELAPSGSASNTIRIVAPDDVEFTSAKVTISSWGNYQTTATAGIRGYLEDTTDLTATDNHKITVTVYNDEGNTVENMSSSYYVDAKFTVPTTTSANLDILGMNSYYIEGAYNEAVYLTPGLSTTINFQLTGGAYSLAKTSLWREIVFGLVIPDGLNLDSVSVGDFTLNNEGSPLDGYETDEVVSGIELVSQVSMPSDYVLDHFGENSGVTGATIYTYKITDPDVVLYGFSGRYGYTRNYFSSFTVSAALRPDSQALGATYAWEKLVALGSTAEEYTSFGLLSASGYSSGDGQMIDNMAESTGLNIGVTNTIVVGAANQYLVIDPTPALMVHDAHVTYGTDDEGNPVSYYYNENDSSSVPVFGPSNDGTLNFTVTNTLEGGGYNLTESPDPLLVYYALPTTVSTTDSALVDTAEFGVTIKTSGITIKDAEGNSIISELGTTTGQEVTVYYLTLNGSTPEITANTSVSVLTNTEAYNLSQAYDSTKHNTILLAIDDMVQYDSFDVSIPFTTPADSQDDELYVKIAGQTSSYNKFIDHLKCV